MALLQLRLNDLDRVICVDPAISERAKAARTAIVCAGISPQAKIFLLDCWAGRQGDPALVIDQILKMAGMWMPRLIGIEMIGYQKALKPYLDRAMRERSVHYPVVELKPDQNGRVVEAKNQRILSMQPFFKAGQVYVQRGMLDFLEEYEGFPQSRTVDVLDALAYAFRLLVPKEGMKPVPGAIQRLAQTDPQSARYWKALGQKKGIIDRDEDDEDSLVGEEAYVRGVGDLVAW